jgi:hypothetical protein
MHRCHQQRKDSPSLARHVCAVPKKAATRFQGSVQMERAEQWRCRGRLALQQLACPAHRFQSTNMACEALFGYACLDLSRLGVAQPMLGVALVVESHLRVCFCCGCVLLLNVEQPPCLCHLSVLDAMSRLTTIIVAWAGWVRPTDMICFLVKTSAPFTSSTCARPTLLYCETQSKITA